MFQRRIKCEMFGLLYVVISLLWVCFPTVVVSVSEELDVHSPLEREREVLRVIQVYEDDGDELEALKAKLDLENAVQMASASANGFVCYMPKEVQEQQASGDGASAADEQGKKELANIETQLRTMMGKSCFLKREGYWSYKVCPFVRVEQIHFEGSKPKDQFSLGEYQSFRRAELDDFTGAQKKADGTVSKSKNLEAEEALKSGAYVLLFANGTNERQTKLFFVCGPGVETASIVSVEEVQYLKYEIIVNTPLACDATSEWKAKQLLLPLRGHCYRKTEGWWTYEFCFEKYLRQFHKEKDGRVTEFYLGEYDTKENLELEQAGDLLSKDKSTNQPILQQKYTAGTQCDIKAVSRSAIVLFVCNSSPHKALAHSIQTTPTSIVSITEGPSCFYEVKVHTPVLCAHPYFKQRGQAMKKSTISKIHCFRNT